MDIYLWKDGAESGPYSEQDIREAVANGSIQSQQTARSSEGGDWLPLETLLSLGAEPIRSTPVRSRSIMNPKTIAIVLASVLIGAAGTKIFDRLTTTSGKPQACRFTPAELQTRRDLFADKQSFYKTMLDHNSKRESELRDELRRETDAGKVALLTIDLKQVVDDAKENLEKFGTAVEGKLRSEHLMKYGAEGALWEETDNINPDTL